MIPQGSQKEEVVLGRSILKRSQKLNCKYFCATILATRKNGGHVYGNKGHLKKISQLKAIMSKTKTFKVTFR